MNKRKKCIDCESLDIFKGGRCKNHYYGKQKEWRDNWYKKNKDKHKEYYKKYKKKAPKIKCLNCGEITQCSSNKYIKRFCDSKCFGEYWKKVGKRTGNKNPAWKNGSHPNTYRNIFFKEMEKLNIDLIETGCQLCGITTSIGYDIHHIVFRSEAPNHPALNTPPNLIYLCQSCHRLLHGKKRDRRKKLVIERNLEEIFDRKLI